MEALLDPSFEYEIFIDLHSLSNPKDNAIISITVTADSAQSAYLKAKEDLANGEYQHLIKNRQYEIWDVTEEDKLSNVG